MNIHLMRPEYLWALLPATLIAVLLWRERSQSGNWSSIISPQLLPYLVGPESGVRRRNFLPGLVLIWALAALAASGPSWEKIPQPVHQTQDALVLVLDLSRSMTAGDLAPSRIDRARQKLLDLLALRREGQTGLVAYAGDAHIVTPLTDDTPTIANLLPALHPNIMPVSGSEPALAVEQAVQLLHSAGIARGKILLLTDGITKENRRQLNRVLDGSGMQLSIMGVGTLSGAPIALARGGFLKDESGAIIIPTLSENELRAVAADNNGRYQRMQVSNNDLNYLMADTGIALPEQTLALDRSADAWDDKGYLLVLLLLPLSLAAFRRGWVVCLLPLTFLTHTDSAQAGLWDDLWLTPDQQGQRALDNADHEAAAQLFENSAWAGTAAYRSEDYETAAQQFSQGNSADDWYNRGNALARAGQLSEAIEAYQESLALAPESQDAKENLELLKQLQEEQEQGDSDEEQQQEQGDKEQQQDSSGQQEQDEPSHSESQQSPSQSEPGDKQEAQEQQQPGEQKQDSKEDQPSEESNNSEEPTPSEANEESQQQAQSGQASDELEDEERKQAMEQWLRRVPDDPSGLLRQKFLYESQQRQQQGIRTDDKTY